jgi:hypothetical protein
LGSGKHIGYWGGLSRWSIDFGFLLLVLIIIYYNVDGILLPKWQHGRSRSPVMGELMLIEFLGISGFITDSSFDRQ